MRSNEPPPRLPQTYHPDLSSDDPDSSSASTSSASSSSPPLPYLTNVKPDISRPKPAKPGRPPKDPAAREKKRLKKASMGAAGGEREGLHVCVTCGRTDSPEWRKGPLGPKTLCNVIFKTLADLCRWSQQRCDGANDLVGLWAEMGETEFDSADAEGAQSSSREEGAIGQLLSSSNACIIVLPTPPRPLLETNLPIAAPHGTPSSAFRQTRLPPYQVAARPRLDRPEQRSLLPLRPKHFGALPLVQASRHKGHHSLHAEARGRRSSMPWRVVRI